MDINFIHDEIDKQNFTSIMQIQIFFKAIATSYDIGAFFICDGGKDEYDNNIYKLKSIRSDKFAPHNLVEC